MNMKRISRLTAWLLAIALVLGSVALADRDPVSEADLDKSTWSAWTAASLESNGPVIQEGGTVLVEPSTFVPGETQLYTSTEQATLAEDAEAEQQITLPQYGMVELTATGTGAAQWQIYVPTADLWVNIAGESAATIALTYAKISNQLVDGAAKLRCAFGSDDARTYSATAKVVVSYGAPETEEATDAAEPVLAASNFAQTRSADAGVMLLGDTPKTYNVVINYLFENNEIVADPYTASLAAGSPFSTTVTFPTIQGYLPYVGENQQNSIDLNYTAIDQNYTINVVYKPTNVNYTVIHYKQNLDNDNYTEAERETKQGLTNSDVPDVAKTYDGFYALLYEKPAIAADGSTVVEVYYDRYYYLMNFDLDGGYGVEPIYARYGTPIGNVGTPTKAGYTFQGWSLNGTNDTLPGTMPAENRTYKAVWTPDNTAKVTVVFWGENADDEEYSYIRSMQVDAVPGNNYSYDGSSDTCPLAEHNHTTEKCTLECVHKSHTLDCYSTNNRLIETTTPNYEWTSVENGIYTYETWNWWNTHYYLQIGGKWYCGTDWRGNADSTQVITFTCSHTHTDACYSCGQIEHTHGSDCSGLWTFKESDTVTVAADGSSVVNVYYDRTTFTLTFRASSKTVATITDKWGADIHSKFPITGTNGTEYKGQEWKVPNGCKTFTAGTNILSIDTMPAENITFTANKKNDSATLYYYVEALDDEGTYEYQDKKYTLYKTVYLPNSGRLTESEEFHEIIGFEKGAYYPNTIFDYVSEEMYLFYTRKAFAIEYYNPTDLIKKDENVPYQKDLKSYYWEPSREQVPTKYEPGSVKFAGWYLNPECTGEKFDFNSHKMPAGPTNTDGEVALSLYAKWVPVTHTVKFYLDKDAMEAGTELDTHPYITVPHGSKAYPTPADPTNGSYTFVGWFYMDGDVEKAFDFANMPVKKDLKVYGKWSSNVLKEYTIYYKYRDAEGNEIEIAAPTTGSGLAGVTKTFEAKGGTELYADYQEGYFPLTKSHSLTLDIDNDANNVFTFWYVQKEAVPYTVKYLNKETGESVATEKTVSDNRKAVVTETFVPVSGYLPDAYQKRLVVSAEEGAVNEIIFYYTEDKTHAYYKITHYTENLAKDAQGNTTWTEYASSQAVGDIDKTYSADPMTIPGFTYDSTVTGTVTSGKLTADGLELKLYYTRNSYPYQVRYLEQGTGTQLADPKNGTGKYGEVISESAIDITNYTAVDPTSQTLNIRIEESTEAKLNIITFYYTEKEVTINYVAVGPEGLDTDGTPKATEAGTVTPTSETLKVLSGTAQGSTAAVSSTTYKFVGWFTDAACTTPVVTDGTGNVPVDGVLSDDGLTFTPAKKTETSTAPAHYESATYYAKFDWNVSTLTITKTGMDSNESAIFQVTATTADNGPTTFTVAVKNGQSQSVTISGLIIGSSYSVTEVGDWTWRYKTTGTYSEKIQATGSTVTITNEKDTNKWLYDESSVKNKFDTVTETEVSDDDEE